MRAFFDIDTQIDFVFPAGALYVPGAELLIPNIAALNRFAVAHNIALISTACAHLEEDAEFAAWGPHCVIGTVGQQKPAALLLGQPIFNKQHTDLFQSPDADALVADFDDCVVYGVVTEVCVQAAAFGLLERGKRVTVVSDAVKALDAESDRAFWTGLRERGGFTQTTAEILEGR